MAEDRPLPEPEFLPNVDWKLGQSDTTSAGCLWTLIGVLALWSAVPLSFLIAGLKGWLTASSAPNAQILAGSYLYFVAVVWGVLATVRYFNPGKLGWWGRLTHRLMESLPHAKATLRAPTTLLPGVRLRVRRQAVILFAPLRIVLVSRGWSPWVLTGGLTVATLVLAAAGPGVFATHTYWFANAIVIAGLGRRIVVQVVDCVEIERTEMAAGTMTVVVQRGPLHGALELTCAKSTDTVALRERIEAARMEATEGDAAIERELAHLERSHADD